MNGIIKVLADGTSWAILAMGIFSIVVIVERIQALYFKASLDADKFLDKLKGLIMTDKIDEAIAFCSSHEHTPFGKVAKSVLERADRDDEAINQALDISLSETIPTLTKRLGYLNMSANVATLFGLFGTITGLILAFQAVSFADPSQKQTLLAQGIAVSMNTTAYGLSVAIPVMIVYSILHARQSSIIEQLNGSSAKLLDMLSARNYRGFEAAGVYTANGKGKKAPPSSENKAS